jgi:hypothetical protein
MATQVQYRRGTAAQNDAFTGANGEITVNTTDSTLRVHNGSTAGGTAIVGVSAIQTLSNKTLASPTLTGNITAANITLSGTFSATGNITGSGSISVTGNITGGNVLGGANVNATTHTGTTVSVTGNITGGNLITAGSVTVNSGASATAIVNGASNGVGNIGSASTYFNQVFAKATTAQYADLAEFYVADAVYTPGTVLSFGGDHEVTLSSIVGDVRVAGVVSTQPAYMMNSSCTAELRTAIALTGKVPTRVSGRVLKGDLMISAGDGTACASANPQIGSVIGKSLEDFNGEIGIIHVVVGRV